MSSKSGLKTYEVFLKAPVYFQIEAESGEEARTIASSMIYEDTVFTQKDFHSTIIKKGE